MSSFVILSFQFHLLGLGFFDGLKLAHVRTNTMSLDTMHMVIIAPKAHFPVKPHPFHISSLTPIVLIGKLPCRKSCMKSAARICSSPLLSFLMWFSSFSQFLFCNHLMDVEQHGLKQETCRGDLLGSNYYG